MKCVNTTIGIRITLDYTHYSQINYISAWRLIILYILTKDFKDNNNNKNNNNNNRL